MKKEPEMAMKFLKEDLQIEMAEQVDEIKKLKKTSKETMSFLNQMLGPRNG